MLQAGRKEKPQNTTDELSDEGGIKPQGSTNYKKGLPGASHPLSPKTGGATNKGKMSLH